MRALRSLFVLLAALLSGVNLSGSDTPTETSLLTTEPKPTTTVDPKQCNKLIDNGIMAMSVNHKEREPFYRHIAERYTLFAMSGFNNNTNSFKNLMANVSKYTKSGKMLKLIFTVVGAVYSGQSFAKGSLIFGLILVFGLIAFTVILSILLCCSCCNCGCLKDRGCCRPRLGEEQYRWCIPFYLLALLLAAALILTGSIIFLFSIGDTYSSLNDKRVNTLLTDVRVYVKSLHKGIHCLVEKTLEMVLSRMLEKISSIPKEAFDYAKNATGIQKLPTQHGMTDRFKKLDESLTNAQKIADRMPGGAGKRMANRIQKIRDSTNNMRTRLANYVRSVRTAIRQFNAFRTGKSSGARKRMMKSLMDWVDKKITMALDRVEGFINLGDRFVGKFQKTIRGFAGIVKGVQAGLGLIMLLPFFFVGLVLGVAIYRYFRYEVMPEERETQGWGHATIVFLYITIVIAIILILGAALLYFLAFMISMVCTSFFKDTELRALSESGIVPLDDAEVAWKISDMFVSCRANDTLVKSFLGPNTIKVEAMINKMDLTWEKMRANKQLDLEKRLTNLVGKRGFDFLDRAFKNSTYQNEELNKTSATGNSTIDNALDTLKNSNNELLKGMSDFVQNKAGPVREFVKKIRTHGLIQKFIKRKFDEMIALLKELMVEVLRILERDAPSCGPIWMEYENAGVVLCELVALPLHGAWAAAGLVAVSMLIPIALYLLVAKWFYRPKLRWREEMTALTPSDMEETMREPTPTKLPMSDNRAPPMAKKSGETAPLLKKIPPSATTTSSN